MKKNINLCTFGHPDLSVAGVFDDTIYSVAHLVRLCGAVPIILRNNIDLGGLNILWGAGTHYSPALESLKQHCTETNTIIFNMEQISSNSPLVGPDYIEFLTNFKILDYSYHNIHALRKSYPLIRAEEFPLLPSPAFCYDHLASQSNKNYHFAFYGAMNDRRQRLLEQLQSNGISVKLISGMYGQNLAKELLDCHAVLNIHAYETSVFETARLLRPVAMRMPVVSETSQLPQVIDWTTAPIKFVDYNGLIPYCIHAVQTGFSELHEKTRIQPEFLYQYHRKYELLSSVRYLLEID